MQNRTDWSHRCILFTNSGTNTLIDMESTLSYTDVSSCQSIVLCYIEFRPSIETFGLMLNQVDSI